MIGPSDDAYRIHELEQRIAELEQARDAAIADCTAVFKLLGERDGELEDEQAKVAALTQALKDYGQHRPGCKAGPMVAATLREECRCGYDAVLIGAQK